MKLWESNMNSSRTRELTFRAAAETMEGLALLSLVPAEESPPTGAGDWPAARVRFSGFGRGTLVVSAPRSMLDPLAANMLGLDDASAASAEQRDDALKELANVVCGNLLPALAGATPVFHIEAPVLGGPTREDTGAPAADVDLFTEAGPVKVVLLVETLDLASANT